jgi:hypothetical protein
MMKNLTIVSTVLAASLGLANLSHASGNTCVYVFGTINGQTVTVPSVMVLVPATSVTLGPLRVHVDESTPSQGIFVPGIDQQIPSFTVSINDVVLANKTCVSFGVTTPAVPVHVPASALTVPGTVVETPEITLNSLGVNRTVSGQVIKVEGRTIVVPGLDTALPSITAATPENSIAVSINGALHSAGILGLP